MSSSEETVLMTTNHPKPGHTVLRMERLSKGQQLDSNGAMHVGGGDNKGIIINRPGIEGCELEGKAADLSLSFKVFLVNAASNVHVEERRQLKFWFQDDISEDEQLTYAQEFFRDLVNPGDFPRDYVGFIMKVIKLMQRKYLTIRQVQVDMKQFEGTPELPHRPTSADQELTPGSSFEVTPARVLEIIESSYPNVVNLDDIVKATFSTREVISSHIQELLTKNIIKSVDNSGFMRVDVNDAQVKMVKQMPNVQKSQQPTIAIITAQYCEKLAVDAMITHKDTYVRYKTEGESNVYTLGNIGPHRVVSTKLPAIGHSRTAIIAAGNTTTRLLGTFQHVNYVFLVGLGGGVIHYTDFNKHVRLGDVVVSVPVSTVSPDKSHVYVHCEPTVSSSSEEDSLETNGNLSLDSFSFRTWCPPNLELQDLAAKLHFESACKEEERTWETYLDQGLDQLKAQESDFNRPPQETDKLYMNLGAKDVLEVIHPEVPEKNYDPRSKGKPMIHLGAIGSGRIAVKDEHIRQGIVLKYGVAAFDSEFDTVVQSIHGNCKEKYIFIRGICDYKDGSRKKEWQPYASLAAAAFMKSMIMSLTPASNGE
ncbi:uncharacterized protein LOC141851880 isoform X2 [Brevipalpus obovatus]|uniref:uncharacterized protein LOC141851880 isoform X2 n=1 Tax=Brevipalpus obovatus TaxID=246614 RepID=UPI003D9E62FF